MQRQRATRRTGAVAQRLEPRRAAADDHAQPSGCGGRACELAKDLLAIAKLAMPDTFYATDSRCQHARESLARLKKLPRSEQRYLSSSRQ